MFIAGLIIGAVVAFYALVIYLKTDPYREDAE